MSDLEKKVLDVQSPCIGVCAMNDATGFCNGCFRTITEIQDWWDLDNIEKKKVVEDSNLRAEAVFDN
jgi:uncharacterized protein